LVKKIKLPNAASPMVIGFLSRIHLKRASERRKRRKKIYLFMKTLNNTKWR
jgi:hypothetical protein